MLPQQRRSSAVLDLEIAYEKPGWHKKAAAAEAIRKDQDCRRHEDGKREQHEDGGDEPGPTGEGHAHERHTGRAHINYGRDEVDRGEQRSDTEESNADEPKRLAESLARSGNRADGA